MKEFLGGNSSSLPPLQLYTMTLVWVPCMMRKIVLNVAMAHMQTLLSLISVQLLEICEVYGGFYIFWRGQS